MMQGISLSKLKTPLFRTRHFGARACVLAAATVVALAWLFFPGCNKKPQEQGLTRITIALQRWVSYGLFYLAEVKLANGRISQKPDASRFLNHMFLETLYEDSQ